jgi:acyl-CoA synthetase (AMP-forming)/AMP-acid ligase II
VTLLPPFRVITDLIREHARARPANPALSDGTDAGAALDYATLDALMDRVAAACARDGLRPGDAVALCAAPSVRQAVALLGALRAGVVAAPLATTATREQLAAMLADCGASIAFVDGAAATLMPDHPPRLVALDDGAPGRPIEAWLAPPGAASPAVHIRPEDPFNIIYSSGTTGSPKGIVQPHGMRWAHVMRASRYGYDPHSVVLLATPLYSNTTLVAFFPALACGGHVHLMSKFDPLAYLQTAERLRATHTMLVPVQYRRLMALPQFGDFDLSSFRMKMCTSAPFDAGLKADILARWPSGLVEVYGLTEGGGTCILDAHLLPDKLHTVGRPVPGHDIRLIDDAGRELPAGPGVVGEIVGRSPGMMTGYHGQPGKTREAEWFDPEGRRYLRTGDIGRFDEDGFLVLLDRRKDMVISGGFNIYPSDLEAELRRHPAVQDAAVVGVPSARWGETPVAFVVARAGAAVDEAGLLAWVNGRVGKTQRLHALRLIDDLPRNAIGKVLKRELRERFGPATAS